MSRPHLIAVALWLALLLGCAAIVVRTEIATDMSAFLPRSPSEAQQVLVDQLRVGTVSRLILLGIEGAPAPKLAALSKVLAERLRAEPDFVLVENGEEAGLAKDRDFLWRNRYLLSPGVTVERFTAAGLRRALEDDLQLLTSPLGALMKGSLPADPTGEILTLVQGLGGDAHAQSRDGVWFSPDGGRSLLLVETRAGGFDIDAQQVALAEIGQAFAAVRTATAGAAAARLLETGPGVFAVHSRDAMKGDAERFSILATVLVAGVLLFAYRSPRVLLLAFLPVATGALAGIAAVGLGFGFVHGITLGFGVTLIGEAVDYAIYLFTQTAPGSPPEATLPRIWPTLRLGMLTSICGFSAMLFSSFTGFAQLGLFTIVGLVVALGVTRFVLPALLPRNFATVTAPIFARPLRAVAAHARLFRVPLALLTLGALALLALHRGGYWENEISSLSPISASDQKLDQDLRHDLGAPDIRYLLVLTAPDAQQALAESAASGGRLQALVADGALTGYDAPDRILPTEATQRLREAALPDPEALRANLTQALTGLPFRAELFEPFLADVAAAKTQKLIEPGDLAGTGLSLKLASLLFQRGEGWVAMLSLHGVTDPARIHDAVEGGGEGHAVFLDLKGESDRLLLVYRNQALALAGIGSLVIVLLLALSLRSPRRVLVVVAPLAAAVILTTAILAGLTRQLSIFNLFGLLLVVAVGSNYALFFERRNDGGAQRERTIASLTLANLSTVIGFGVLSFSRIPVLHGIGGTVAMGAFFSLVFAAIVSGEGKAP